MAPQKDYQGKRSFEKTPEPAPQVKGDVDPHTAPTGNSFVIHQHHASRLHFDLRLEMLNGRVPVLVSWAVPKNLPLEKGKRHLAIHVEDHPFEYGKFSGSIPAGNYGAGHVRIFDSGGFEVIERDGKKLTFRLSGGRVKGIFHLVHTNDDNWLVMLSSDERPARDPLPTLEPMMPVHADLLPEGAGWSFEPAWPGDRAILTLDSSTHLDGKELSKESSLSQIHNQVVATDAVIDGVILASGFIAVDLLYMDGKSLIGLEFQERRQLLEASIVPAESIQVGLREPDAQVLTRALKTQGLEGLIAKDLSSKYEPGVSSESWVRVNLETEKG